MAKSLADNSCRLNQRLPWWSRYAVIFTVSARKIRSDSLSPPSPPRRFTSQVTPGPADGGIHCRSTRSTASPIQSYGIKSSAMKRCVNSADPIRRKTFLKNSMRTADLSGPWGEALAARSICEKRAGASRPPNYRTRLRRDRCHRVKPAVSSSAGQAAKIGGFRRRARVVDARKQQRLHARPRFYIYLSTKRRCSRGHRRDRNLCARRHADRHHADYPYGGRILTNYRVFDGHCDTAPIELWLQNQPLRRHALAVSLARAQRLVQPGLMTCRNDLEIVLPI